MGTSGERLDAPSWRMLQAFYCNREESTMSENVASSAFLVRLSISQFRASKLDKKASKEARERANAGAEAGVQVRKRIIASDALEAIGQNATAASAAFRRRTVAWQYDGVGAITADG